MLALDGLYAPTVLRCRARQHTHMIAPKAYGYYRLVCVLDGIHDVQLGDFAGQVPPETGYLVMPGIDPKVHISTGARTLMMAFTVIGTPLLTGKGQTRHPADKQHQQPLPQAIWGCDIPV